MQNIFLLFLIFPHDDHTIEFKAYYKIEQKNI